MWNNFINILIKAYILVCYLEQTRTHVIQNDMNIEIAPGFVELGESLTVSCTSAMTIDENISINRDNTVCVLGCYLFGSDVCDQSVRILDVSCDDNVVVISVSRAVENDFTTWTCRSAIEGDTDEELQQFMPVILEYINYVQDAVEGQHTIFTCQATDGVPGAVIKWKVNGIFRDDFISQINDTNTQTSSFTLTPHRSHTTLQCLGDQVPNKDLISGEVKLLNVLYPPLKATAKHHEIVSAINKTTHLQCVVEDDDGGHPASYTFTWTRAKDTSFNITNNGDLTFVPNSVNFQDVYSCYPVNAAGTGLPADIHLTIKVAPVISSLTALGNSTSTVVALSCYLNSTGGSQSLTLSLWYHDSTGNSSGIIKNIPNYADDGNNIHLNVDKLMPSTTYIFVLRIQDQEDALYSENITATGQTTESPIINLLNGKLESDQLTIQWDYVSLPGYIKVTVCLEYWILSEGRDSSTLYPSTGLCDIPVHHRMITVLGTFQVEEQYHVFLHIYENGFLGTSDGQQIITISGDHPNLSPGDIAAITVSVLFSLFLLVCIILSLMGVIIVKPFYTCRDNQKNEEQTNNTSGVSNGAYEIPEKSSGIYANQAVNDETYEELKERHTTEIRASHIDVCLEQENA